METEIKRKVRVEKFFEREKKGDRKLVRKKNN